ncbi:uncharacterized protein [Argopecten irradians]|uniref:uncharacterized protein n=1 Tax=Argopecten irradians TaxID=31199 RepID=UPI00371F077D
MDKSNFDYLFDNTAAKRQDVLKTPFVQGVKKGNLEAAVFDGYVVQDCVYLYEQYRCIQSAIKVAKEGDLKVFLEKIVKRYEGYYQAAFKLYHIDNPSGIKLGPACQKYVDYMRKASTMDTIYFIVSMTPCLSLWAWLGDQVKGPTNGVYAQWVKDNFVGGSTLKDSIEKINKFANFDRKKALDIFEEGMGNEFDFFNSAGK